MFHFRKIDKAVSVHQFGITALLLGNFVGGICALGFLLWQLALVFTGTTTHELKNGLPAHSICQSTDKTDSELTWDNINGIWSNFRDICGPYWFITVILPMPMPQDGLGLYKKVFRSHGDCDKKRAGILSDSNGKID